MDFLFSCRIDRGGAQFVRLRSLAVCCWLFSAADWSWNSLNDISKSFFIYFKFLFRNYPHRLRDLMQKKAPDWSFTVKTHLIKNSIWCCYYFDKLNVWYESFHCSKDVPLLPMNMSIKLQALAMLVERCESWQKWEGIKAMNEIL